MDCEHIASLAESRFRRRRDLHQGRRVVPSFCLISGDAVQKYLHVIIVVKIQQQMIEVHILQFKLPARPDIMRGPFVWGLVSVGKGAPGVLPGGSVKAGTLPAGGGPVKR